MRVAPLRRDLDAGGPAQGPGTAWLRVAPHRAGMRVSPLPSEGRRIASFCNVWLKNMGASCSERKAIVVPTVIPIATTAY